MRVRLDSLAMTGNAKERLGIILRQNSILRGKFKLASGKESDYYIDARLTTLHPEGAYLIGEIFLNEIKKDSGINAVGGPTIGADPIVGSLLYASHRNGYPLSGFLVRKTEKDHGTGKLIEGNLKSGDRAVIVEDVVTTGGSVLKAVDAVRGISAEVSRIMVIVDREEGADKRFSDIGIDFYSIFKISELL